MSKCVIFPAGKHTEAVAYIAWTNDQFAILAPGQGTFNYSAPRPDKYDPPQWVTSYLGPDFMWMGVEVPEPAGGAAQRADGVIAVPEWPDEE